MKRYKLASLLLIPIISFSLSPQNTIFTHAEKNQIVNDHEKNDSNSYLELKYKITPRSTIANLQEELWYNEPLIYDILVGPQGEIYISGTLDTDNFWFGAAQGFVSKLTKNGVVEWTEITNGSETVGYFNNMVMDSAGNILTAGQALANDLSSSASLQDNNNGAFDVYLRKYTPSGDIIWDSYLGGFDFDCCAFLEVDSQDNYYLTGGTVSFNFPADSSIINNKHSGGFDSFMTKIDNDGNLIWSSLFGGKGFDGYSPTYLISDDVLAFALSTSSDNLPTVNAVQNNLAGRVDIYLGKRNTTSGELIWGTYYGATNDEYTGDIKVDKSGNMYVVGDTLSENFTLASPLDQTLNGTSDGFILKFDPTGTLLWSSFIGGNGDDRAFYIEFDIQDNPIVVGYTTSSDFPTTDGSSYQGGQDIFITRISSDGSSIISSTLMGGTKDEATANSISFNYISETELLISSNSFSNDFVYGQNKTLESFYPHTFGGESYGFIINYNLATEDVNWATTLPAIPEPYLDYDQDGLTNQEEYNLCFETTPRCIDPINPDSDGDGMSDGWELDNDLSPLDPFDATLDSDGDGLTNLQEFGFGTKAKSNDSDSDLMPDLWEISMGLDPLVDDALIDSDNDVMTNVYEYEHGFNASNFNDGALDFDNDGASNTKEFLAGTDPLTSDTDGDGMPDGFELEYNLDPFTNDANDDADGDLIPNKIEFELGLDPQSKIELYFIIGIVTVFTAVFYGFRRRNKIRNKEAVKEGWESHKQKKQALKSGFDTVEEYKDGVSKGFGNKRLMDLVDTQGFKSVDEMIISWNTFAARLTLFNGDKQEEEFILMINDSISPKQLLIVENNAKQLIKSSEAYQDDLNTMIAFQSNMKKQFNQEKGKLFSKIVESDIDEFSKRMFSLSEGLEIKMKKIDQAFTVKKEWFAPWQPLLTLIQITGDGMPISLDKIGEVTNTSQDQAEELLLALLSENPEIGSYDKQGKMYTKGTDVSKYLEDAMKMSKMLDEEVI